MFRKNVAGQFIHFQGVDASTGGIKSGVTWTVRRCIDGTFAAGGGTVTEDGSTGWYRYAMSQADTNGNNIGFNFTGTGAVPQTVNIITTAADPTDAVRMGLTALPNANAEAAGGLYTRGTGAGQVNQSGNGLIDVSLKAILNTALTETSGQIAAAFKKFFDKASPTGTVNSLPDAVPGAAGGLLVDDVWTDARAAKLDNLDTTVSSRGTGAALDAAGVRSAIGLASANLDTQLGAIPTATEITDAVLDESLDSHQTAGTVGSALINSSVVTGFRQESGTVVGFHGGEFDASYQGESIVVVSLSIDYDNQYQGMLFVVDDSNFPSLMRFVATIVSSDTGDNSLTLTNSIPERGASDPIPFLILPAGIGDANRALILYEGN